jgi:hypothetical protein
MKIAAGTETLICSLMNFHISTFTHPKRTMMTFERLFRLYDSEKNERKNQKLFPDQHFERRKIGEKISLRDCFLESFIKLGNVCSLDISDAR